MAAKPSKFVSSFTDSNHKRRNSRLFFITTFCSGSRARRQLRVKNVTTDGKDVATQTQQGSLATNAPDSSSIALNIKYHAEFTPSFSIGSFALRKDATPLLKVFVICSLLLRKLPMSTMTD
ncbi:hypothetical protein ACFX13_011492 [Malus domestica]